MIGEFINQFKAKLGSTDNPKDALSFYNNGLRMVKAGFYDEALQDFKKSASVSPKQALTFFQIGNTYFHLDKFADAKRAYERFLKLISDLDTDTDFSFDSSLELTSIKVDVYNKLGIIYDGENNFLKATGAFRGALRLERNNIDALNNLGAVYFRRGIYPEAIKAYEQILKFQPDNVYALYGIGMVYLDLKNRNGVKQIIQTLENLDEILAADLNDKILSFY